MVVVYFHLAHSPPHKFNSHSFQEISHRILPVFSAVLWGTQEGKMQNYSYYGYSPKVTYTQVVDDYKNYDENEYVECQEFILNGWRAVENNSGINDLRPAGYHGGSFIVKRGRRYAEYLWDLISYATANGELG